MHTGPQPRWLRRAQPLLGTLVEVGVVVGKVPADANVNWHVAGNADADARHVIGRAFDRVRRIQTCLSRFDPSSDIGRFESLRRGEAIEVQADTRFVLDAAAVLGLQSGGLFDVSLGTGASAWQHADGVLRKLRDGVRLDLGGIAKGHAVDCAVQSLLDDGIAAGWVNAGGDLRCFGAAELPIRLRDERDGGVRPFATLTDGAFATSCRPFASACAARHVSVAAPQCLWADALTKVIALSADAAHPVLACYGARAWIH